MDCVKLAASGTFTGEAETLILVLDVSSSMEDDDWFPSRLDGAKEASLALLEEKRRVRPDDFVGIVSFSSRACLEQAPVNVVDDYQDLQDAIDGLYPKSSTNMGAGLREAGRCFSAKDRHHGSNPRKGLLSRLTFRSVQRFVAMPRRLPKAKHIIHLSDGDHNGNIDPVRVAQRLKKNGVVISCIGIGGSPEEVNEALMKRIASKGPGGKPRYWFIGQKADLIQKFEELATGLRAI